MELRNRKLSMRLFIYRLENVEAGTSKKGICIPHNALKTSFCEICNAALCTFCVIDHASHLIRCPSGNLRFGKRVIVKTELRGKCSEKSAKLAYTREGKAMLISNCNETRVLNLFDPLLMTGFLIAYLPKWERVCSFVQNKDKIYLTTCDKNNESIWFSSIDLTTIARNMCELAEIPKEQSYTHQLLTIGSYIYLLERLQINLKNCRYSIAKNNWSTFLCSKSTCTAYCTFNERFIIGFGWDCVSMYDCLDDSAGWFSLLHRDYHERVQSIAQVSNIDLFILTRTHYIRCHPFKFTPKKAPLPHTSKLIMDGSSMAIIVACGEVLLHVGPQKIVAAFSLKKLWFKHPITYKELRLRNHALNFAH